MTEKEIQKYRRRISDEMYITAYGILLHEIEQNGETKEVIELSKELSKVVRGKAYYYAVKKAEKLACEMDALLKLVIRINGEGIYG